jgi:hypothetical protein
LWEKRAAQTHLAEVDFVQLPFLAERWDCDVAVLAFLKERFVNIKACRLELLPANENKFKQLFISLANKMITHTSLQSYVDLDVEKKNETNSKLWFILTAVMHAANDRSCHHEAEWTVHFL